MANVRIYKGLLHNFALALTVSEILTFIFFYIQKVGQGHGVQFLQRRYSMANVRIHKHHYFTFLIVAKMRPVRTIVTRLHTHTQHTDKDREMDKPMTIGGILQIFSKN